MSIFAGIYSRRGEPIPESMRLEMYKAISRNPDDSRTVFSDSRAYLVQVDHGSFGEPAFRTDPVTRSVAMLAGEPLLNHPLGQAPTRSEDLKALQTGLDGGSSAVLRSATGIFALAHYNPKTCALTLTTDKLGQLPVYCWFGEKFVVFATALRILEELTVVPKRMDVLGVTELCASATYNTRARTPYADIKSLTPAEIVLVADGRVESDCYWDWRRVARPEKISEADAVERTHELFIRAIRKRLRDEVVVPACLSGGLDSRSVVAGLRSIGLEVYTFCYYADFKSQEQVFAAEFARAIGTHHTSIELPIWESGTSFETRIKEAWLAEYTRNGLKPTRPMILWTGDGGSVGLGHLLITPNVVAHLRAGRITEAFAAHRRSTTARILKPDLASSINEMMLADFREQIEWTGCEDPVRAFHLFLMLNQQRGDFNQHYEHLDVHRLEFRSPFYDSDVLASVLSLPVDWCLGHKFYHKWLRKFPAAASSVPWQTYPEHEPCPIPVPPDLGTQWDAGIIQRKRALKRKRLVEQTAEILASDSFPVAIMRKNHVRLARWLHAAGVRDCEYALTSLEKYHTFWGKCEGAYKLRSESHTETARIATSSVAIL